MYRKIYHMIEHIWYFNLKLFIGNGHNQIYWLNIESISYLEPHSNNLLKMFIIEKLAFEMIAKDRLNLYLWDLSKSIQNYKKGEFYNFIRWRLGKVWMVFRVWDPDPLFSSMIRIRVKSTRIRNPAWYCISKMSCPIIYRKLLYKIGRDFLDTQYLLVSNFKIIIM